MAAYGVLFVCTGNICRSPTAEGLFRHMVEALDLEDRIFVDSAGTHGYHVGNAPDPRTVLAARARGFDLADLCARRVEVNDFQKFDLIAAMDRSHLRLLRAMMPQHRQASIALFSDFIKGASGKDVPDPYYGGDEGFETVLDMVSAGCEGILAAIQAQWRKEEGK